MTYFESSKPRRMGTTLLSGNAVLRADTKTRDLCARTLAQRKLPVENRLGSGYFDPASNKIKVMTMKVSKGLEFPVVALPGVGYMPAAEEDEKETARVFYVAATRATQKLLAGIAGNGRFGQALIDWDKSRSHRALNDQ